MSCQHRKRSLLLERGERVLRRGGRSRSEEFECRSTAPVRCPPSRPVFWSRHPQCVLHPHLDISGDDPSESERTRQAHARAVLRKCVPCFTPRLHPVAQPVPATDARISSPQCPKNLNRLYTRPCRKSSSPPCVTSLIPTGSPPPTAWLPAAPTRSTTTSTRPREARETTGQQPAAARARGPLTRTRKRRSREDLRAWCAGSESVRTSSPGSDSLGGGL